MDTPRGLLLRARPLTPSCRWGITWGYCTYHGDPRWLRQSKEGRLQTVGRLDRSGRLLASWAGCRLPRLRTRRGTRYSQSFVIQILRSAGHIYGTKRTRVMIVRLRDLHEKKNLWSRYTCRAHPLSDKNPNLGLLTLLLLQVKVKRRGSTSVTTVTGGGPADQGKPHLTEPNRTKPNLTEPNQTKSNQTKPNQTKPNQTKPNQTKPNQTKPN